MAKNLERNFQKFFCCVCYNAARPPFLACRLGHSGCIACYSHFDCCPSCKEPFSKPDDICQIELEREWRETVFACSNFLYGCPSRVPGKNLLAHEGVCEYDQASCPGPLNHCVESFFVARNREVVVKHLNEAHDVKSYEGINYHTVKNTKNTTHFLFLLVSQGPYASFTFKNIKQAELEIFWQIVLSHDNQFFVLSVKKTEALQLDISCRFIGTEEEASKYLVQLEMITSRSDISTSRRSKPPSFRNLLTKEDVVQLNLLESFCDDDTMTIYMSVVKILT